MRTHYEILGVSPEAEDVVIDAAYRALMKRHHPDVQGGAGETRAKEINEAYRVLRDPAERARYDRELGDSPRTAHPAPTPGKASAPPPPPPAARVPLSEPPAKLNRVSWSFIGLALLVLFAAVGSLSVRREAAPAASGVGDQASLDAAPPPSAPSAAVESAAPTPAPPAQEAVAMPAGGVSPSFDCGKADTEVLRMICMIPDLAASDASLADAYRAAVKIADDPTAVRAAQRAWLERRDAAGPDPQALQALYTERLGELRSNEAPEEPVY